MTIEDGMRERDEIKLEQRESCKFRDKCWMDTCGKENDGRRKSTERKKRP